MMDLTGIFLVYFIFLVIYIIVFVKIGAYLAREKNRDETEGKWLGGLLGVIGLLIIVLLPTKEPNTNSKSNEIVVELSEEERRQLEEEKRRRFEEAVRRGKEIEKNNYRLILIIFPILVLVYFFLKYIIN